MKKLMGSTPAKMAAVILSYITVFIFVLSTILTLIMGYYKFYFSNQETVTKEILTDMAEREAYYLNDMLNEGDDIRDYYSDKNLYYIVTDEIDGGTGQSNYNGEEYIVNIYSDYYVYRTYHRLDDQGNSYTYTESVRAGTISIYIPKDMTHNDLFSVAREIISIGFKLKSAMIFIMIISFVLIAVLFFYMFCAAGRTNDGEIKLNYADKLPIDIYICLLIFAAIWSIIAICDWPQDFTATLILSFIVLSIDYFLILGFLLSIATRIKTGTLFKNSLLWCLGKCLYRGTSRVTKKIKYTFSNISLVKKTWVLILGIVFSEIIFTIICANIYWYGEMEWLILLLIPINIFLIILLLYFAVVMQEIKNGGEKIASGETEHKINTTYMLGDFKDFAESLNNINDGLQNAINERIKSERFKTELITNVSHDIKTPLTSIINYVDLIKKEKTDNPVIAEHIEVLERQSVRLKKLVEDLVDASKASSGSISVEMLPCDVNILLSQSVGEFEDRLKKAKITPVFSSTVDLKIMADARHLWRVFDNLLNNVCKYAMPDTRLYISAKQKDGYSQISFTNISRFQLNISPEELTERFVRGDKSRHSEGSGLGLSIAKSLVELQDGKLELQVDGDVFKAVITFKSI